MPLSWCWLALAVVYFQVTYFPYSPDSYSYIDAAQSLLERGELTVPFAPSYRESLPVPYTAWPPGYPLLIAGLGAAGIDLWSAASVLSILGLVLGLFMFRRLTSEMPGGDWPFLLVSVSAPTALIGSMAWSEGPFLACVVGAWYAAYKWQADPKQRYLIVGAVCIAAGMMLRYVGIFLIPAWLWLIWKRGTLRKRMFGTALTGLACLPLAIWTYRNSSLTEGWRGAATRAPELWRAPAEALRAVGEVTFAPPPVPGEIQAVIGLAAGVAGCLWVWRRRTFPLWRSAMMRTSLPFLFAAVLVLIVARATGRIASVLDARLLWPVLPFAAAGIAITISMAEARTAAYARLGLLLYVRPGSCGGPLADNSPELGEGCDEHRTSRVRSLRRTALGESRLGSLVADKAARILSTGVVA